MNAGLSTSELGGSLAERFESYFGSPEPSGCILWHGTKNRKGYGVIRLSGATKKTTAHRIAWVFKYGDIPAGTCVLHRCDNPSCINVDHLFLGSYQDNTDDMVAKERHPWRFRTPWQKLNSVDGERIRDLRAAGCTQQEISDWFGVSRPLISMILGGRINHSARL